jgi:hypothetical protein
MFNSQVNHETKLCNGEQTHKFLASVIVHVLNSNGPIACNSHPISRLYSWYLEGRGHRFSYCHAAMLRFFSGTVWPRVMLFELIGILMKVCFSKSMWQHTLHTTFHYRANHYHNEALYLADLISSMWECLKFQRVLCTLLWNESESLNDCSAIANPNAWCTVESPLMVYHTWETQTTIGKKLQRQRHERNNIKN